MKKYFRIFIFICAFFLITINNVNAEKREKIKLDWEKKFTYGGTVVVHFLTAQLKGERLLFDVLLHNTEKERYMCVWFNTSQDAVHMDDELGNAYKGAKINLKPMDNKFAPNQRKRLEIILPKPDPEVEIVNIHFGFDVSKVESNPQTKCGNSIIRSGDINFHKLDWNLNKLR